MTPLEERSPEYRLIVHIMTSKINSFQDGVKMIQEIRENARKAKEELIQYRAAVRLAKDADPNWTDEEIDLMIIEQVNSAHKKKGKLPI